jgi:hypothetical protein
LIEEPLDYHVAAARGRPATLAEIAAVGEEGAAFADETLYFFVAGVVQAAYRGQGGLP